MARKIDENKINAIKKATIETVVLEGISGASVSKIAEKAGVSVGYLYRFYKGKRELLEALFEERFELIHSLLLQEIEKQTTVKDIVSSFVQRLYKTAEEEPQSISFTHKLLSDFSFELSIDFKKNVEKICDEVLKKGKVTKEIDSRINGEILYSIIVGGVLNFINIRFRNIFGENSFVKQDIDSTVQLVLKTLAPNF